jgi:urea transport system substrate-binding protein
MIMKIKTQYFSIKRPFHGSVFPLELNDSRTYRHTTSHAFRIGLLIPMCGSAGLWAPSCIASAQIAVEEVNKRGGILDRKVELIMIDAALEAATPVEEVINSLIEIGAIDAIVGMHISAVRQKLSKIVNQRVPYIYTPLYEGGENTKGIFAIGDTPSRQLDPALEYLQNIHSCKKWALIGNDYVWPRTSNNFAKTKLKDLGVDICYERYIPFGISDMSSIIKEIRNSKADAVLISLVGQDAVTFNREFGKFEDHQSIVRLSCAIEENCLLASGQNNLREMYAASSYFGSLRTSANDNFREKYHNFHGDCAPVLNAIGVSTYEGVQFLQELLKIHPNDWKHKGIKDVHLLKFASVKAPDENSHGNIHPMYIAKANGIFFEILDNI